MEALIHFEEPTEDELRDLEPDILLVDSDLVEGHSSLGVIREEDEGQARELEEEEVEDESEGDKKEVLNGEKESEPDVPRFSRKGRRIRRPERLLL